MWAFDHKRSLHVSTHIPDVHYGDRICETSHLVSGAVMSFLEVFLPASEEAATPRLNRLGGARECL